MEGKHDTRALKSFLCLLELDSQAGECAGMIQERLMLPQIFVLMRGLDLTELGSAEHDQASSTTFSKCSPHSAHEATLHLMLGTCLAAAGVVLHASQVGDEALQCERPGAKELCHSGVTVGLAEIATTTKGCKKKMETGQSLCNVFQDEGGEVVFSLPQSAGGGSLLLSGWPICSAARRVISRMRALQVGFISGRLEKLLGGTVAGSLSMVNELSWRRVLGAIVGCLHEAQPAGGYPCFQEGQNAR